MVFSQITIKSGIGLASSNPIGIVSELDAGVIHKNSQLTAGWQFNPTINKTVYNIKYGYWYKSFTITGGVGLVNHFVNIANSSYVYAYGTPIIGVEYNTKEFTKHSRVYFGIDVVDKTVLAKIGIKLIYDQFSVF